MGKIALVEVFRSVQGEGFNTGRAAIFVRFAGCNLACKFAEGSYCDTPYQQANITVDGVSALFGEQIAPLLTSTELDLAVDAFGGPRDERLMLILTGGEPTRQPAFDDVVRRAKALGFYVAVETNGTRFREAMLDCDWISVSPKDKVAQGSPMPHHNPHPGLPGLDRAVVDHMVRHEHFPTGEYRYVVSSRNEPAPTFLPAYRHYVSPATIADGSGTEWQEGFKGFVPGAVERALEIVQDDPRWRLSLQTHKITRQR